MSIPDIKKTGHTGRKIVKLRELLGVKQETLASLIGVTQQNISKIEKSEDVDDEKLQKIATALGVTVEAIRNFNEDNIYQLIQNNNDTSTNNYLIGYQHNSNDKMVELYERLLKEKDMVIEMYKKMLNAS